MLLHFSRIPMRHIYIFFFPHDSPPYLSNTVCRIGEKLCSKVWGLYAISYKVNDIYSFYSKVYLHFTCVFS